MQRDTTRHNTGKETQRERERVGRGWGPGVLVSHAAVSHVLLTKAGDESPHYVPEGPLPILSSAHGYPIDPIGYRELKDLLL